MPPGWAHGVLGALTAWIWADVALGRVPGWPELAGGLVAVASLVWSVVSVRAQGFGRVFCRGSGHQPWVALTFDDGPDPNTTPRVLETLARHGAVATFFVVGHKVRANPNVVRAVRAAGHHVALHGHAHRWWVYLLPWTARRDLRLAQEALGQAVGETSPWFRPPYGLVYPPLVRVARQLGLRLVGWSVRSWDTIGPAHRSRAERILRRIRPGDVLLLHDAAEHPGRVAPHGPDWLELILVGLRERGLTPVTLPDLAQPRA